MGSVSKDEWLDELMLILAETQYFDAKRLEDWSLQAANQRLIIVVALVRSLPGNKQEIFKSRVQVLRKAWQARQDRELL